MTNLLWWISHSLIAALIKSPWWKMLSLLCLYNIKKLVKLQYVISTMVKWNHKVSFHHSRLLHTAIWQVFLYYKDIRRKAFFTMATLLMLLLENDICMICLKIGFVHWVNNFYKNIPNCVNSGWKPRAVIMFAFLGFSWKASFRHYHYQLIVLIIYFFSSVCDYWLEQSDDKQTNKRIRESQLQLKRKKTRNLTSR